MKLRDGGINHTRNSCQMLPRIYPLFFLKNIFLVQKKIYIHPWLGTYHSLGIKGDKGFYRSWIEKYFRSRGDMAFIVYPGIHKDRPPVSLLVTKGTKLRLVG
jgi:hypothetical protein